jgi:hypothetical protein
MYAMKDYMNFMSEDSCSLFHLPSGYLTSPDMIHLMLLHGWRITPSRRDGWSIMVRVPTLKREGQSNSSIEDEPPIATEHSSPATASATSASIAEPMGSS